MQAVQLYKPFPHQRAVHGAITAHLNAHPPGDSSRQVTFAVNAMRQVGKTTMVGNEIIRFALAMPKKESVYIAPTYKLTRKMVAEFSKALTGNPLLDSINKTENYVSFANGHSVYLMSAEQGDAVRGFNASGVLVIDEFAYMRDEFLDNVVAPFTDFHKTPTITISTPRGKRGKHYEFQVYAKEGQPKFVGFDWAAFDMSCIRSAEWLEDKRRTLPERTFRTDYLGEFLDNEGAVFRNLNGCILAPGLEPAMQHLKWGIDWAAGSGNDRTVLTAFNDLNEQVYLKAWDSTPPMQQVSEIARIINDHKEITRSVIAEKNSMGAVYIDALRKECRFPVVEFVTTNEEKRRIIENLVKLTEAAAVGLKPVEAQLSEFDYFESHTLPSGAIVYSAPVGLHDDYVMAAAIALSQKQHERKFMIL